MFYSYRKMLRYRENPDVTEAMPCWSVTKEYEEGEEQWKLWNDTEWLTGTGMENLTMAQAKQKAEELNNERLG